MQRIEETPANSVIPEKTMCANCNQFFGSPAQNGLCSKCFKEVQEKLSKSNNNDKQEKQETTQEKPQEEKIVQNTVDKKVCQVCNKRVGYLGFACKCNQTFCKLHRMPEAHNCEYNFKDAAINKLKSLNPVCSSKKMEYI